MAFLDELKKITRPYDEDEDFFMNDDEQDEFDDFREEPVKPAKPAPVEFDEPAPAKSVFQSATVNPSAPPPLPQLSAARWSWFSQTPKLLKRLPI